MTSRQRFHRRLDVLYRQEIIGETITQTAESYRTTPFHIQTILEQARKDPAVIGTLLARQLKNQSSDGRSFQEP